MGKPNYNITDSETEETSCSSLDVKKKKKFSILRYTNASVKKKKSKVQSKSEPEDSDYRSRSCSSHRERQKLHGILKTSKDKQSDRSCDWERTSDEEDDSEPVKPRSVDRCFVGQVPRPPGSKPGRGGGVSIVIMKNANNNVPRQGSSAKARKSSHKRLMKKRSY